MSWTNSRNSPSVSPANDQAYATFVLEKRRLEQKYARQRSLRIKEERRSLSERIRDLEHELWLECEQALIDEVQQKKEE